MQKSLTAPLEGDDLKLLKRMKTALARKGPPLEAEESSELRRTGFGYYLGTYVFHYLTKTKKAGWFRALSEDCVEIAEGKTHHCFGWWGVTLTALDELETIYPQNLEQGQEVKVWAKNLDFVANLKKNAGKFSRKSMWGSQEPPLPGYFDSQELQDHLKPARYANPPTVGAWSAMFLRLVEERLGHLEAALQASRYLEAQELHRFVWEMLNGLSAKALAGFLPEGRQAQIESQLTLAEDQIKDALS